jgi:DNA-directed RNA polymerase subunit M/transcription elongation factor TFIIS
MISTRRPSMLRAHETKLVCPTCGEFMTYEPPHPHNLPPETIGVLGCSSCGHAEPAELVREYEAARTEVNDE